MAPPRSRLPTPTAPSRPTGPTRRRLGYRGQLAAIPRQIPRNKRASAVHRPRREHFRAPGARPRCAVKALQVPADSAARSPLCGSNPLLSLGAATQFNIANFLPPPEEGRLQTPERPGFLITSQSSVGWELVGAVADSTGVVISRKYWRPRTRRRLRRRLLHGHRRLADKAGMAQAVSPPLANQPAPCRNLRQPTASTSGRSYPLRTIR